MGVRRARRPGSAAPSPDALGAAALVLRFALVPEKMSDLEREGRARPEVVVVDDDDAADGPERRAATWEVKARELERSICFFCRLGGGWP
jgi:hypothetical protein